MKKANAGTISCWCFLFSFKKLSGYPDFANSLPWISSSCTCKFGTRIQHA